MFEFNVEGNHVMRRRKDQYINATHILKVADYDKPARTRILEREVQKGKHEKVQGGYGKYQGQQRPTSLNHLPRAYSPPQVLGFLCQREDYLQSVTASLISSGPSSTSSLETAVHHQRLSTLRTPISPKFPRSRIPRNYQVSDACPLQ